jgi:hypothetical protein
MDLHFKIRRAREEIERLDIEIPRVITNIRDERHYLLKKEAEVLVTNPALAHQIALYRMERGCFDADHTRRFQRLTKLQGFVGSIQPGRSLEQEDDVADDTGNSAEGEGSVHQSADREELEEEEAAEEDAVQVARELFDVLRITIDS